MRTGSGYVEQVSTRFGLVRRYRAVAIRIALILWGIATLVVMARAAIQPVDKQSVFDVYVNAARHWVAGQPIYDWQEAAGYRYAPTVAILFVPALNLPDRVSSIIWRLLNTAVFLGGMWWCWSLGIPTRNARKLWAIALLMVLPLAMGAINSAQANCLLAGLLLCAIAAAHTERWWLSAVLMALASMLKIYPLSLALLLWMLFPRKFSWRFVVCCAIGLLIPFVLQRPSTAIQQYADWIRRLAAEDRHDRPAFIWYHDIRLLLRNIGLRMSPPTFVGMELIGGAAIAWVCWAGHRAGWSRQRLLGITLALASCWMTVLGPSTEITTYTLIAAPLAWMLCDMWMQRNRFWMRAVLVTAFSLQVASRIVLWLPNGRQVNAVGIAPLSGLLFMGAVFADAIRMLPMRDIARGDLSSAKGLAH
jgi:hypothetical protein